MRGSIFINQRLPNPVSLLARTVMVCGVVLWLAHIGQHTIIRPLMPWMQHLVADALPEFKILSFEIAQDGSNDVLRLRANLAEPLYLNGRMFYPVGYGTGQSGGYQIAMTVGGALQYSLLTLILVLAWPHQHWRELVSRLLWGSPIMIGLILFNAAITFPAELWGPLHDEWLNDISWPLLIGCRILMGGGGLALALLCGIAIVAWCTPKRKLPQSVDT
jgi:hypothetical protein